MTTSMERRHSVQVYDYVNQPYETVAAALRADPNAVFERATKTAAAQADTHRVELRAKLGMIDVAADVVVEIEELAVPQTKFDLPCTKLAIRWRAAHRSELFPAFAATLSIFPLTPTETQLELTGYYVPPLGVLGDVLDAVAMHRIAEVSVQNFVHDVRTLLCTELTPGVRAVAPGPG
jgi:hypothetical protein